MSLKVEGVQKSFGPVEAVRDVSFSVPEGHVLGLIGPNGAGKTTTMRMILRILDPDTGIISWNGKSVAEWPLGTFGYLPEERGLYPLMRGRDELRFFGNLHGMTIAEADAAIAHWGDILDLNDVLNKKVDDLSKGNAQKLQFLAAVLHKPKLLVLDEPFSGLDPMNTRLFKDAVRHVQEQGATIVFSSHQMDHVEELCDLVCMIAGGQSVIYGSVQEVRQATGRRIVSLGFSTDAVGTIAQAAAALNGSVPASVTEEAFPSLPGLLPLASDGRLWRFVLQNGADPNDILRVATDLGPVQHFSVDYPTLEEIYMEKVTPKTGGDAE